RSLVAIKRDGAREPALILECPTKKSFRRRDIALGAQQEIGSFSIAVDSTIEVSPAAFDLYVGLIDAPGGAGSASKAVPTFFEFRDIARYPAHDRRMGERNSALGHHFHEISKAQLEPEIPKGTQDDDLAVEMMALEEVINA